VAALVCGTWGYFYLQDLKRPTQKPFDVLPDPCTILAEIKGPAGFMRQLTQGNLVWEELLKISDVKEIGQVMARLDSLTSHEEMNWLGDEPFYIAFYGGPEKQEAVYAFNLSDINETGRTLAFFERHFSAQKLGPDLYKCALSPAKKGDFYVFIGPGLVIASASKERVQFIREAKDPATLSANKRFMDSYKTAAKDQGLRVFLHLPDFYDRSWNKLFTGGEENYFSGAGEKWLAADVDIEPSDIHLQGFLPTDSVSIARVAQNQQAGDFNDLFEQLPYGTFSLNAVNISDYAVFCRDNYRGNDQQRKADLKKYSDSLSANAQTEILSFMGDYAAQFKTSATDTVFEYGLIQVSDEEKARAFFRSTADSTLINTDSANLFLFSAPGIFSALTATFFRGAFTYVTVLNEHAIFGRSVPALAEYRKVQSEKIRFSGNERAMQFLERNFNTDLNFISYSDVFKNKHALENRLSPSLNKKLEESPGLFEKFDAIGFSLQTLKETIFYKIHASFNPKNKIYQNTLWEAFADTALYRQPVAVINHTNNEKELVCQDMNNILYLLSNTGKILWKKALNEKMLGDPVQIDHFANGKLQMLFASENYIHLVDRNGNYVQGFPVRIKSGASGALTVFDYERTKNYRIWLPLKDNTVICLNMACKTVEGFVPVSIKAPLARPINHLLLQQKDYFILTDTLGNVYVTNRKGEPRANLSGKLPQGGAPLYIDKGKDVSKTYLCFVDIGSKTLRKLSLEGKMEVSLLPTDDPPLAYFFDTLANDAGPQLALLYAKELRLFDLFAKRGPVIDLSLEHSGQVLALSSGDKKVYAVQERTSGILHLADAKTATSSESGIVLSALPASYPIIKGRGNYLIGYHQNKIYCIKP